MNKEFLLKKYLEDISIPRAIGTKGNTETKKKLISFCKSFLPEKNIFIDKFRFTKKAEKISLLIFSIVVSLLFCALWLSLYYLLKVYFFIAIILLFGFIFLFFNYWLEIFNFIGSFGKIKCESIIVKVTNSVSNNKLLVTAHRDSLSSRPRGEIYFKLFNLLFFYMPVSLGLLGIILINVYLPPFFTNFLLFLFGIYPFSLLFFVLFTSFGNESPGAYDNGTGLAILMALIKKYAGKKLPLQLWVAFLDCEEAGYGGSYSLAKKLNKDFFVLNLDGIGSGDLELAYADGPFKSKTSKFLNSKIYKICKNLQIKIKPTWSLLYPGSDHVSFVKKGFKATMITSSSFNIHSKEDTIDKINFNQIKEVLKIIDKLILSFK